jgi:hypothetical protein
MEVAASPMTIVRSPGERVGYEGKKGVQLERRMENGFDGTIWFESIIKY